MSLTQALNPIMMLGRQAVSYARPVAREAWMLSKGVTKDALSHGMKYYAIGGAAIGGGLGGYNAYENRSSVVAGSLKGAAMGGLGGAAIRMGMSTYGMRGAIGKGMMGAASPGVRAASGLASGLAGGRYGPSGSFVRTPGPLVSNSRAKAAVARAMSPMRLALPPAPNRFAGIYNEGLANKVAGIIRESPNYSSARLL